MGDPDALVVIMPSSVTYGSAEIGVYNRIYRTWRDPEMSPYEHVKRAVLALMDLSPIQTETLRADLTT